MENPSEIAETEEEKQQRIAQAAEEYRLKIERARKLKDQEYENTLRAKETQRREEGQKLLEL
jgi:vacuolar-type H+-ATPase subunit H